MRVSGNLVSDKNATKKHIKATENVFLIYIHERVLGEFETKALVNHASKHFYARFLNDSCM